jgi:hypothetical protein
MTKGEVKSLNDLAMAHGGHLTVNPKTGLPEAGFLSSILPMALGFALGPAGFLGEAALSPMAAGLVSGAAGMVLNPGGGLMGGLMAGMGGYGGASLGQSLAQQGMAAEAQTAQQAAEAAKLGPSIMTQAPAQASTALNPTQLSSLGVPSDTFQSVVAPTVEPGSFMNSSGNSSLSLGAPMTANGTLVSDLTGAQNANYALQGVKTLGTGEGWSSLADKAGGGMDLAKTGLMAAAPLIADSMKQEAPPEVKTDSDPGQQYKYAANPVNPTPASDQYGRENKYFNPTYVKAAADGGSMWEQITGGKGGQYPGQQPGVPEGYSYNPDTQQYTKLASGGISDAYSLGSYSDGGRLLRGPGDGVSDSIPAIIGKKQPARLADGEFVVPARIVSELGNGSTEAGARKLYAMMDRIQSARSKTVGKGKVAKNSRAEQHLPA